MIDNIRQKLREYKKCLEYSRYKVKHQDTRMFDNDGYLILPSSKKFDTIQDIELKTKGQNIVYA